MQRIPATILLLVVSLGLMTPLLALYSPQGESTLPACCRRDGKHGCAKMRAAEAVREFGGARLVAGGMRCAQYPCDAAAPCNGSRVMVMRPSGETSIAPVPSLLPVTEVDGTVALSHWSPVWHKRGPPADARG